MRTYNTREYLNSHGSNPRGTGSWAFVPADYVWPNEMPSDAIAWAWGTYADAKREIANRHPEITAWVVLP